MSARVNWKPNDLRGEPADASADQHSRAGDGYNDEGSRPLHPAVPLELKLPQLQNFTRATVGTTRFAQRFDQGPLVVDQLDHLAVSAGTLRVAPPPAEKSTLRKIVTKCP